ncbi:hypothetical protein M3E13_12620 [Oceanobacillus kimchii]|uniref:Uncharacterized protein n=1 Tax=Oceanobacillus kimchii TaxID=746691 RepID=A0ABQ5TJ78_9BACI|nr:MULTISPECIES: hypothetical protein [Oceanobacillus]MCT1577764.1 hypothetical protein [Oceanobacillus kimchii]MCT2136752.1 hypothetical protein [Oceanobacillus kimchii]OEH53884.1 hypothetical protein AQ616_15515 [Oceanobacillus sp. E9]GLO64512.1 hypothetical protein MACH08_02960 [Oceanobacillus kimchii]
MNTKILKLLNEIYPLQITEIEVTNELYRCKADKRHTLSGEQVWIMNHFRIKIENNHTLLNLSEMYI